MFKPRSRRMGSIFPKEKRRAGAMKAVTEVSIGSKDRMDLLYGRVGGNKPKGHRSEGLNA